MIHYLVYDGQSSLEYGVHISGTETFDAPERDITALSIPGRNGDLIFDNGRYKNIDVTYPAFIHRNFARNAQAMRAWLMKSPGYKRLEDTYHPDLYRLAYFKGPVDFETTFLNWGGETELVFTCKPQRFFVAGDLPIDFLGHGTINNEYMPAKPLIKVYGSGAGDLNVGEHVVNISDIDEYVMLDCDLMDAYKGTENKNSTITAPEFPVLEPGANSISWTGGITSVQITPRWWTI